MINNLLRRFSHSHETQESDSGCQKALQLIADRVKNSGTSETLYQELQSLREAYPTQDSVLRLMAKHKNSDALYIEAEHLLQQAIKINKKNPLNWDALGLVLLENNRAEEADKAFEKAVKLSPKNATYHHHRGMSLAALNWHLRAARAQQHAVNIAPDFAEAHNAMGVAFSTENQLKQAINAFTLATKTNPKLIPGWKNLALALKRFKKPIEAVSALEDGCQHSPDNLELVKFTAWMEQETNQAQSAAMRLQEAIEHHPDAKEDADCWFNLAECQFLAQDYVSANDTCNKAIELAPEPSTCASLQASIYMHLLQADKAETILRQGIAAQEDNEHLYGQLGLALDVQGKQQEAQEAYKKSLELNPENYDALSNSISFRKANESDQPLLKELEQKLKTEELSRADEVKLQFAIGKLNEDLKNYPEAFEHFHAGNQLKFRKFNYHEEKVVKTVDALTSYFSTEKSSTKANDNWHENMTEKPVFIIGMPRSGTSLVEQIIASHSLSSGAGELMTLPRLINSFILKQSGRPEYPAALDKMTQQDSMELSEQYLLELKGDVNALRVTDKLPYNFFHVGLINKIFPNANIIHCQRNPVDTCVSCYFQNFTSGNEHTFNLDTLAEYYQEYQRLMSHWESVLPNKMINIVYEDLVSNPENEAQKLINSIGLEWEENCLEFHKTKRSVQTASTWQVRQEIYKSSTQRWKRYGSAFNDLEKQLMPS